MIGIVDYNAGNLKSVSNALERIGVGYRICASPSDLKRVRAVVLPGVGQFAAASRSLRSSGLFEALQRWGEAGKPIVGICLGMQLLFESSEEAVGEPGLGILEGSVVRLKTETVPHMGWNRLSLTGKDESSQASEARYYYFAHGYIIQPEDESIVVATAGLDGISIPSMIATSSIRATQFHPEKSGPSGAKLLKRMLRC